jgi:hypothetical protein
MDEQLAALFEADRLPTINESFFELGHPEIGIFGCEGFDCGARAG